MRLTVILIFLAHLLGCTTTSIKSSEVNIVHSPRKLRLDIKGIDHIKRISDKRNLSACDFDQKLRKHITKKFNEEGVQFSSNAEDHLVLKIVKAKPGCGWCKPLYFTGLGHSKLTAEAYLSVNGKKYKWTIEKKSPQIGILDDLSTLAESLVKSVLKS